MLRFFLPVYFVLAWLGVLFVWAKLQPFQRFDYISFKQYIFGSYLIVSAAIYYVFLAIDLIFKLQWPTSKVALVNYGTSFIIVVALIGYNEFIGIFQRKSLAAEFIVSLNEKQAGFVMWAQKNFIQAPRTRTLKELNDFMQSDFQVNVSALCDGEESLFALATVCNNSCTEFYIRIQEVEKMLDAPPSLEINPYDNRKRPKISDLWASEKMDSSQVSNFSFKEQLEKLGKKAQCETASSDQFVKIKLASEEKDLRFLLGAKSGRSYWLIGHRIYIANHEGLPIGAFNLIPY